MELKIHVINEILDDAITKRNLIKLETEQTHMGIPETWEDGLMGEYNEFITYYSHPLLPENIFVAITIKSNSYGEIEDEQATNIKFAQATEKTIKVYEPI